MGWAVLSHLASTVCERSPSHGENRGSSPLGSANLFNYLVGPPSRRTARCLFFIYYPSGIIL